MENPGLDYNAEPTVSKFHHSKALIKGIRGPVGSGKTVGCYFDLVGISMNQEPCKDGVRYTKFAVVRNTYPELLSTSVETWEQWFGPYSHIRRSAPIEARMRMDIPDGTQIDVWLLFLALDVPADVRKLKSLEVTGSFLNEASEMGRWVLTKCFERRGRYPPKAWGVKPTWAGVIMDTNSCDDDHWWYLASEEEHNQGWQFFSQPPALLKFPRTLQNEPEESLERFYSKNPRYPEKLKVKTVKDKSGNLYIPNPMAENVGNLPLGFDYWLDQIPGKPLDEITVFILNDYGTVSDSKPVYPEYIDSIHCSKEPLKPIPGVGVTLGFDFGRTPACSISQITAEGQKRVLHELLVEEHGSMGIRLFSRFIVVPYLLEHYLPWLRESIIKAYGDPAGSSRSDTDEKTCFIILNECPTANPQGGFPEYKEYAERLKSDNYVKILKEKAKKGLVSIGDLGIQVRPARTQSFEARRDAVGKYMNMNPDILISCNCKYIRKGMRGKYHYKRVQVTGESRYKDEPVKNIYSHINEAFQYDCLESEFEMADPAKEKEKEEKKHRKEIGSAACAAWDELRAIKEAIARNEYDEYCEENYV